ncbi:hypothetical protein FRC11_004836 [Ceratobasidium sp. 423]|nr:hypothetical protein FRC11_004836 [Ceratobasidium sp. 423]
MPYQHTLIPKLQNISSSSILPIHFDSRSQASRLATIIRIKQLEDNDYEEFERHMSASDNPPPGHSGHSSHGRQLSPPTEKSRPPKRVARSPPNTSNPGGSGIDLAARDPSAMHPSIQHSSVPKSGPYNYYYEFQAAYPPPPAAPDPTMALDSGANIQIGANPPWGGRSMVQDPIISWNPGALASSTSESVPKYHLLPAAQLPTRSCDRSFSSMQTSPITPDLGSQTSAPGQRHGDERLTQSTDSSARVGRGRAVSRSARSQEARGSSIGAGRGQRLPRALSASSQGTHFRGSSVQSLNLAQNTGSSSHVRLFESGMFPTAIQQQNMCDQICALDPAMLTDDHCRWIRYLPRHLLICFFGQPRSKVPFTAWENQNIIDYWVGDTCPDFMLDIALSAPRTPTDPSSVHREWHQLQTNVFQGCRHLFEIITAFYAIIDQLHDVMSVIAHAGGIDRLVGALDEAGQLEHAITLARSAGKVSSPLTENDMVMWIGHTRRGQPGWYYTLYPRYHPSDNNSSPAGPSVQTPGAPSANAVLPPQQIPLAPLTPSGSSSAPGFVGQSHVHHTTHPPSHLSQPISASTDTDADSRRAILQKGYGEKIIDDMRKVRAITSQQLNNTLSNIAERIEAEPPDLAIRMRRLQIVQDVLSARLRENERNYQEATRVVENASAHSSSRVTEVHDWIAWRRGVERSGQVFTENDTSFFRMLSDLLYSVEFSEPPTLLHSHAAISFPGGDPSFLVGASSLPGPSSPLAHHSLLPGPGPVAFAPGPMLGAPASSITPNPAASAPAPAAPSSTSGPASGF